MDKKIPSILAIGIILIIAIIIGGLIWLGSEKQEAIEKKTEETKKEVVNNDQATSSGDREDCIASCITMWISNKDNEGTPESKMMSACNSLCAAGQGIQNQDADSCANAEGIFKDICYTSVANKTKDSKLCEKVIDKTFASACYTNVAEETKDASICDKVPDKRLKDDCLDGVNRVNF